MTNNEKAQACPRSWAAKTVAEELWAMFTEPRPQPDPFKADGPRDYAKGLPTENFHDS
jgi:hypothetical protein